MDIAMFRRLVLVQVCWDVLIVEGAICPTQGYIIETGRSHFTVVGFQVMIGIHARR